MLSRMELSAEEIRVLGCLVEKQLTTPQAYPLTESAVIAACNQSTNREPVVSYDQTTVRRALLSLRHHGLAKMIQRPGDRVEKHRHLFDEALSLSPAHVAVLDVLMLRGPQTVGELRTRTERLHRFAELSEVDAALSELAERQPQPLVERMPRLPGQKEARFRHLLGAAVAAGATAADQPVVASPAAVPAAAVEQEPSASAPARAAADEEAMRGLRDEVATLRSRVDRLERELGLHEPS